MQKIITLFFLASFSFSYCQDIELIDFASGLTQPVNIKHAGDDRLFVTELKGKIKIIGSDGMILTENFIDLSSVVSQDGGERGLLGLAFHPNFSANGYFYVNYVNSLGNTVISRFKRSENNENQADLDSELIILSYIQPYPNHNGGEINFGPDGFLYIASGDGGSGGDPQNNSQNLNSYLGKLLRIDVDQTSDILNYSIPADNPFINTPNALSEIWAYGLRNPWRFSFDRDNNDLWIADVGQNLVEEINKSSITEGGINYGWRCYEGMDVYNSSNNCDTVNPVTFPISTYTHSQSGVFKCSITGGYRYRGNTYPDMVGKYVFADYCSSEIGLLTKSESGWDMSFTPAFSGNSWTTFGEDKNGELYIAAMNLGKIYKIAFGAPLHTKDHEIPQFRLFPNPAQNILNINIDHRSTRMVSIKIYDLYGKYITGLFDITSRHTRLDIASLQSGLYFVEISDSSSAKHSYKFVKK